MTSTCDRKMCKFVCLFSSLTVRQDATWHKNETSPWKISDFILFSLSFLSLSLEFKVAACVSLCWLACCTEGELISPTWLSDVIFTDSWAGVCHRVFLVTSVWVYSVFICMLCVLRLEWTYVSSFSFGECEAMSLWVIWCSLLCVCVCSCALWTHTLCVLFHLDNTQGDRMSQLSSTSLSFLVAMAILSRVGSGDKVKITRYLLCD